MHLPNEPLKRVPPNWIDVVVLSVIITLFATFILMGQLSGD